MRKFLFQTSSALALTLLSCPFVCFTSHAAPTPVKKPVPKKAKQTASPPVHMSVVERDLKLDLPDPKHPGRLQCHLEAVSSDGVSTDTGLHGNLSQVQAQLYQLGKPTATLTAPHAHYDQTQKSLVVTATGGVVSHSLIQPGTKLTADQVVWYARSNQITATGHVFYHDGKTGFNLHVPKLIIDTQLKTWSAVGPGRGSGTF